MPFVEANGVRLAYESRGEGPPLVFVHGSWSDLHAWDLLAPRIRGFRAIAYDRRGHGDSEPGAPPGTVAQDAEDLAALVGALHLDGAFLVGSSFGSIVSLRALIAHPARFRAASLHEPPLMDLLSGVEGGSALQKAAMESMEPVRRRLEAGDAEGGARVFVEEVVLGPGAWATLPPDRQAAMIRNAFTWLEEVREPGWSSVDREALRRLSVPVQFTRGSRSFPWFPPIVETLGAAVPRARVRVVEGAGHVPHLSHPGPYADLVMEFLSSPGSLQTPTAPPAHR